MIFFIKPLAALVLALWIAVRASDRAEWGRAGSVCLAVLAWLLAIAAGAWLLTHAAAAWIVTRL